jgi:hypothetical protein
MTSIKMAATALAAVVLAGCAATPMPPIATHTFVIFTRADDSALTDKATLAALQAHPLWLRQYGDLRRAAVDAIAQRLTHDLRGWRMAPAVDVSLIALAATHHEDGHTLIDAQGAPRPEVAELIKRLDVDAVFVVTERTLAKGPFVVGNVEDYGGIVMGWEQVAVEFFDRTRLPGKEAAGFSLTDRILELTTPEARAAMLKDLDGARRDLEDMLRERGY